MDKKHFLRSHCRRATPDGKCCQSLSLDFQANSASRRSSTVHRKRITSLGSSGLETQPVKRLFQDASENHRSSVVDTPVSLFEKSSLINVSVNEKTSSLNTNSSDRSSLNVSASDRSSSLNAAAASLCSCEYMSTRSRTSSLVESDVIELSTLTKTGYTYAKSRSYRQQVTPDRIIPPPNMSRSRVSVSHEEMIGNRDGNISRASSVGSHYSTHSYYLRSGSGSPGLEEEEVFEKTRQRRKYPVSPSGKAAFNVPRGLDHESDSSPEDIPRRRSLTPVTSTSEHYTLNGRASLSTATAQRLTPLEEEEEEDVTVIRRVIKIFKVYNERIIRYVSNSVSPPLPVPPDVAASSLPVGVAVVQKRRRGWRWLWWLLLPLALALLYVPASSLYKDQIRKDWSSVLPTPSVPIVLPSDGVSEEQKKWVNSLIEKRIYDAVLNIEGRLKNEESENIVLKKDLENRFQELADFLTTVQSDLAQSKAAVALISEKASTEGNQITELQKNLTATVAALGSQKEELSAVGGYLEKLKVELESVKSCCQNDQLAVGLADAVAALRNKQDTFESLIAGLKNDQSTDLQAEIEKIRGEFSRQLALMEVTLRAEADSTRTVLMQEVATQAAAHAVAAVAAKTTEISVSGVSEEFVAAAIAKALAKYDADKIGMADFALESAGGEIASIRCTEPYTRGTGVLRLLGIPLWYPTNNPRVAIQRGVNPGECWAFKGDKGFLVVKLARPIRITAVTIEHISKSISVTLNVDTAPRNFSVLGLRELEDPTPREIGNFTYDSEKSPLQTFYILDQENQEVYPYVELRILSNHGNKDYTCLYRFRVHGIPASAGELPVPDQ